jgi:hypothetical protein
MKLRHLLVAVVALALLSGCTVVTPAAPEPDTAPPSGESSTLSRAPLRLANGSVVATGELVSVDNLTSGDVSIVAAARGEFRLEVEDFVSPPGPDLIANLSAEPFTEAAYCDGGFMMLVLNDFTPATSVTTDIPFGEITLGNPDFLDSLVITLNDANAPRTGCFYSVLATAELSWTMPDLRPDIAVKDSGPTGGASGPVTEGDNGIGGYEVVEIAARFGISVLDLMYLNPARDKGQQRLAFAGEIFNLDKAGR